MLSRGDSQYCAASFVETILEQPYMGLIRAVFFGISRRLKSLLVKYPSFYPVKINIFCIHQIGDNFHPLQ